MILAALSSPKGAEVDHHSKLHQDEEPNGKEDGHEGKPRIFESDMLQHLITS